MYYIDGVESTVEQFATAMETHNYTYVDINSIMYDGRKVILNRIRDYKNRLKTTDYQATKNAEGELDDTTYLPLREQRAAWRAAINELESILDGVAPVVKTFPLLESEPEAETATATTTTTTPVEETTTLDKDSTASTSTMLTGDIPFMPEVQTNSSTESDTEESQS